MQETGTNKLGSRIMNLHKIRPRMPINKGIGSLKKAYFQSHISEIADKQTTCNHIDPLVPSFRVFVSARFTMNKLLICGKRLPVT